MGSFLHFDIQTRKMLDALDASIDFAENHADYPRSVAELKQRLEPDASELVSIQV